MTPQKPCPSSPPFPTDGLAHPEHPRSQLRAAELQDAEELREMTGALDIDLDAALNGPATERNTIPWHLYE